ncbi:MAG: capsule assembly Wzi family protein [Gammaproteobacteria bacterium]|nr:capsule assembly Wzi family protein [Gammaproteobacteria bacterium]
MQITNQLGRLTAACALGGWLLLSQALAAPWIDPGDPRLRQDLELLADAGIVTVPVTTWPLAWAGIGEDLDNLDSVPARADVQAALLRVRRAYSDATEASLVKLELAAAISTEPRKLRTFSASPREKGELSAGISWTGLRFSYRLRATGVSDPSDDLIARADGSYVGAVIGNYMITAGQLDRWWGPGWHNSMILSSNARPVPGVSVQRNFSDAPTIPGLRWIGPWTLTALLGQLEHDREVPDAWLFGLRVNFRPRTDLEIGISRTAQWCGGDRPCDLATFADLLLGRDNRGESTNLSEEPGNQLAGVDWRWRLPVGGQRWNWYGQFIGEDEAGGLPSRFVALSGLSWTGYSELLGGGWSSQLEWADSAAEFYKDPVRYDYAYEHFIYRDGYRYRSRSLGASMDNDGRMIGINLMLNADNGQHWQALVRRVDLNRGGDPNPVAANSRDLWNIELAHLRALGSGKMALELGIDRFDDGNGDDVRISASWRGGL